MKRDMDLVRTILKQLDNAPLDATTLPELKIPDHSTAVVSEHVRLAAEAGLIKALDLSSDLESNWRPERLTWHGYEFLEAYRNDTFWQKGKELVLKTGGALTLEGLKLAIPFILKTYIGVEG